ncbi:MAG: hypothetical protein H9W81_07955 [Enterococcus sp.]|nr:hypothetical protein [Enterococcus sp.]
MSKQERRFTVGDRVQMEVDEGVFLTYFIVEVLPKNQRGWDYRVSSSPEGGIYTTPCLETDLI